jgi:hypothetical protein
MSLEHMQETISLLRAGSVVCTVFALIFFGLALFLFFRFNITQIIRHKTGSAVKRESAVFSGKNSGGARLFGEGNSIALGERTPIGLRHPASRRLNKVGSKWLKAKETSGAPPGRDSLGNSSAMLTAQLCAGGVLQSPALAGEVVEPDFVVVKEVLIVHVNIEGHEW